MPPRTSDGNGSGAPKIGLPAFNAKWVNYGLYERHLAETVDKEWEASLTARREAFVSGNYVTVTFKLNSKGEVPEIISVNSTPGTPKADILSCITAIRTSAPYAPWTASMISALGTEAPMSFTFYFK